MSPSQDATELGKTGLVRAARPGRLDPQAASFRAAEVAELLGLEGRLRYDRLHALDRVLGEISPDYKIKRMGDSTAKGKWRRYTTEDIARLVILIDLCGGSSAFGATGSSRLRQLSRIRTAAAALTQAPWLIQDPLLSVRLLPIGGSVLAVLDGQLVDPVTGQFVIDGLPMRRAQLLDWLREQQPDFADRLEASIRFER